MPQSAQRPERGNDRDTSAFVFCVLCSKKVAEGLIYSKSETRNWSEAVKEEKPDPISPGYLRRRAEELLGKEKMEEIRKMTDVDFRALVYEMQVHRIELEMQNEELKRAHTETEDALN